MRNECGAQMFSKIAFHKSTAMSTKMAKPHEIIRNIYLLLVVINLPSAIHILYRKRENKYTKNRKRRKKIERSNGKQKECQIGIHCLVDR